MKLERCISRSSHHRPCRCAICAHKYKFHCVVPKWPGWYDSFRRAFSIQPVSIFMSMSRLPDSSSQNLGSSSTSKLNDTSCKGWKLPSNCKKLSCGCNGMFTGDVVGLYERPTPGSWNCVNGTVAVILRLRLDETGPILVRRFIRSDNRASMYSFPLAAMPRRTERAVSIAIASFSLYGNATLTMTRVNEAEKACSPSIKP